MSKVIRHRGVVMQPFDEAQFRESQRRVRAGVDHGALPVRPAFDLKQFEEHRENHLQKRSIDDYKTVLEHYGFCFFTDQQLMSRGAVPTGSGLWRSERLQEAFSCDDVLSMFPTPQEFDAWISKKARAATLAKAMRRGEISPQKRQALLRKS